MCDKTCVDPSLDTSHCGGCDNPCDAHLTCISGKCGCAANLSACGETCVDTNSDPKACGACGIVCGDGAKCDGGKCIGECGAEQTSCNDACTNLLVDFSNCGKCGLSCEKGQLCAKGVCSSPPSPPKLVMRNRPHNPVGIVEGSEPIIIDVYARTKPDGWKLQCRSGPRAAMDAGKVEWGECAVQPSADAVGATTPEITTNGPYLTQARWVLDEVASSSGSLAYYVHSELGTKEFDTKRCVTSDLDAEILRDAAERLKITAESPGFDKVYELSDRPFVFVAAGRTQIAASVFGGPITTRLATALEKVPETAMPGSLRHRFVFNASDKIGYAGLGSTLLLIMREIAHGDRKAENACSVLAQHEKGAIECAAVVITPSGDGLCYQGFPSKDEPVPLAGAFTSVTASDDFKDLCFDPICMKATPGAVFVP